MRNRTYRWNDLYLYDYRGVEKRLEAMASKGWRLEKAGPQLWTYRRSEPARVHYAVTYIPDSSQFNPGPTEGQETLAELCGAAGWEKVCDWYQMQIFCSEADEPVPLETDESLRLEVVHRSMRRNFLPGNIVMLILALFMASLWIWTLVRDPVRLFENNSHLLTGPLWILAAALGIFGLGGYYLWYRRSACSVAEGGSCAGTSRIACWVNRIGMVGLILYCAGYLMAELVSSNIRTVSFMAVYLALIVLLVFLVRRTTAVLRKRGASWGKNVAGTFAVDIVLAMVMMGGLIWGTIHFDWFGFRGDSGETYSFDHMEWDVSPEEIPLTLSDLTGREYPHIRRRSYESGSLFMSCREYHEAVRGEESKVWISSIISYEITEIRSGWLYQKAVEKYTRTEIATPWDVAWKAEDPSPWGAESVYRRYRDGEGTDTYLLCLPGRLVKLSLDDPPTAAQMEIAGERLRP